MNAGSLPKSGPAVEVRSLHKRYHSGLFRKKCLHALQGVDLTMEHGEVFGLLGPNGAGKTTLIKVLLGIVGSSGGHAEVMGFPAGSSHARRLIGYLPENMSFPHHHTAIISLYLYGRLSDVPTESIRRRSVDLLKMVGLEGREREPVKRYSKGMKQRLALAQALLHEPQLLIMDEPTDGLDPLGRAEMRSLIAQLKKQGKTVFLNSHILQEVELVCDRVAIMSAGRIQGIGTPSDLISRFQNALQQTTRLELLGDSYTIRSVLAEFHVGSAEQQLAQESDGSVQLSIKLNSQQELDGMIDCLRARQISIRSVQPVKASLEDVFLNTVQSPN